jgi:FMNH2-dependent dimethyl sulfone monooxygenase
MEMTRPKMAFGVWLPVYGGWLRARGFDTAPSFTECLDVATTAENHGFSLVYASENFLNPVHGANHDVLDAWSVLAGVAARTQRIGLVGALKPMYRPALVAAQMTATVDKISGGRLGLNIACGWWREEFDAAGVDWRPHDDKYVHATAYLQQMAGFWGREGPRRPLAEGKRLPIWVSGHSDAALTLAAAHADVLFLNGMAPDDVRAFRARLEGLMPGRTPPRIAMSAFVIPADTDHDARERRAHLLSQARPELIALYRAAAAEAGAVSWDHLSDAELLDPNGGFATALVGSAANLRERIRLYESAGVDLLICQFPDMQADVRRFGRDIIAPEAFRSDPNPTSPLFLEPS